jgi:hypothetical protein
MYLPERGEQATFTTCTRGQNIGRAGAKCPPPNDNSKELQQSLSIAIIMLVLSLRLLTICRDWASLGP